jgi:hypothetical protein
MWVNSPAIASEYSLSCGLALVQLLQPLRVEVPMKFVLRLTTVSLASGLLFSLGCSNRECRPDPCADVPGTVCFEGECLEAELTATATADGVSGELAFVEGGVVEYQATRDGEGAGSARLTMGDESVEASFDSDGLLALSTGGLTMDGNGELTAEEQAAIDALAEGPLADALALVPLQLGCAADVEEVPYEAVGALLAPWQAVLKYHDADRAERAKEYAERSGCAYFADSDGSTSGIAQNYLIRLSWESPLPAVLTLLPFDDVGEYVDSERRAMAAETGPCNSLCRGACGADCQPINCDQETTEECEEDIGGNATGYLIASLTHTCGTAPGCQEHDDCYDTCHAQLGCGTWDAAYCRRGCDIDAAETYGYRQCAEWAQGLGPFTDTGKFTMPVPGGVAALALDECPLVGGALQWQETGLGTDLEWPDAVAFCQDLSAHGHDDWYLPALGELNMLTRGCDIYDCTPVDWCDACDALGGPEENGCYWDQRLGGECVTGWWSSTQFEYQSNYKWMKFFHTGDAGAGADSNEASVRCVRMLTEE